MIARLIPTRRAIGVHQLHTGFLAEGEYRRTATARAAGQRVSRDIQRFCRVGRTVFPAAAEPIRTRHPARRAGLADFPSWCPPPRGPGGLSSRSRQQRPAPIPETEARVVVAVARVEVVAVGAHARNVSGPCRGDSSDIIRRGARTAAPARRIFPAAERVPGGLSPTVMPVVMRTAAPAKARAIKERKEANRGSFIANSCAHPEN